MKIFYVLKFYDNELRVECYINLIYACMTYNYTMIFLFAPRSNEYTMITI